MSLSDRGKNRGYDPFEGPIRLSSVRLRVPLWWSGWRPLATGVIAGFIGITLGSVVATWRLRWLDTVGGGGVPAGVATPSAYASTVLVAYAPGLAVVALCLAIAAGVWFLGCREINRRYEAVIASFFAGIPVPTTDSRVYTLHIRVGGGSPLLVEPRNRYVATHMVLGDDEVAVYDGSLDMIRRHLRLGECVETVRYDDVTSVHDAGSSLELETTDGEIRRYECASSREPTAVLHDLRDRLDRPSA